jgi:hypothetical protein
MGRKLQIWTSLQIEDFQALEKDARERRIETNDLIRAILKNYIAKIEKPQTKKDKSK